MCVCLADGLRRVRRDCLWCFPPGGVSSFWFLSLRASVCFPALRSSGRMAGCWFAERGWVISIARLRTLPPVYLRPIDVIVFDGPYVEILS